MGIDDLFRNAAAGGQNRVPAMKPKMQPVSQGSAPEPVKEVMQETAATREEQPTPEASVSIEQQPAPRQERTVPRVRLPQVVNGVAKYRFIKRPDLPDELYREVPATSTYQIYNDEIESFVKGFSSNNARFRGGAKITPSMLIEALLDIAYYDMDIRPEGFVDVEDLRDHIRSKLK